MKYTISGLPGDPPYSVADTMEAAIVDAVSARRLLLPGIISPNMVPSPTAIRRAGDALGQARDVPEKFTYRTMNEIVTLFFKHDD